MNEVNFTMKETETTYGASGITLKEILARVDHTLLKTDATWEQIRGICDDAIHYGTATVCIPPSFVKQAAGYMAGRKPVCTVIGFPNGYNTTEIKCAEAAGAVRDGADEVDMVINLGWLREGRCEDLLEEINAVKRAAGSHTLKVIVETCMLSADEKAEMARLVSRSDADFIKTSTGFAAAGATFDDIRIFKENVTGGTKIKAAGGISSLEDAAKFIELGADRLGTSRIVKIAKEME